MGTVKLGAKPSGATAGGPQVEELLSTSGALHVHLPNAIAGERNTDSATNSYLVTHEDWNITTIDLSTDASTTVSATPCRLGYVYVSTVMSAHVVDVQDNATIKFILPASTAAGTLINFRGARFETSLVINPNDSSTGVIAVAWRPI